MASTTFVDKTTTIPTVWLNDVNSLVWTIFNGLSVVPTVGKFLRSDGTNLVGSAFTVPSIAGTAGKIFRSDGTNILSSTFTIPDTYAVGDLLQATSTNVLTALTSVATGNALISGGVTTASSWGKIGLTTHITGTLAIGNGGTGLTTFTAKGAIPVATAATTLVAQQVGSDGQALVADSNQTSGLKWGAPVLRSYLAGLTLSTAGSSATMSVAAGSCADTTNVSIMSTSAISKTTSAWAVGSATGGLDTGAIANSTWYHFYVIQRVDTGVVDVLFSLNATAPTMPTNYTLKRRIGSGKTNGSAQWTAFIQNGDDFYWSTPPASDWAGAGSNTAVLTVITVPTGIKVKAYLSTYVDSGGAGNQQLYLSDPACANVDPAVAGGTTPIGTGGFNGSASQRPYGQAVCWTDTSAQIRHRETNTNVVAFCTLGWMDLRGKND